jgi:Protein of unknown function (DUF3176)
MVPIISVLGQLKWLWFKDDARLLTDFELYNGASGGGVGSVKFSLRMLFKSWVIASHCIDKWRRLYLKDQLLGLPPLSHSVLSLHLR